VVGHTNPKLIIGYADAMVRHIDPHFTIVHTWRCTYGHSNATCPTAANAASYADAVIHAHARHSTFGHSDATCPTTANAASYADTVVHTHAHRSTQRHADTVVHTHAHRSTQRHADAVVHTHARPSISHPDALADTHTTTLLEPGRARSVPCVGAAPDPKD